jgi:hypothetical protein
MSESLPFKEITSRYDGEWVVLTDIEPTEGADPIERARVLFHGGEEESWRKACEIGWEHCRVIFVGKSRPDRDQAIITRLLLPDSTYEITPEMIGEAERRASTSQRPPGSN